MWAGQNKYIHGTYLSPSESNGRRTNNQQGPIWSIVGHHCNSLKGFPQAHVVSYQYSSTSNNRQSGNRSELVLMPSIKSVVLWSIPCTYSTSLLQASVTRLVNLVYNYAQLKTTLCNIPLRKCLWAGKMSTFLWFQRFTVHLTCSIIFLMQFS